MGSVVGLNKKVFVNMVSSLSYYEPSNDGFIFTTRFPINDYDYDYSHAIISYMKDCGFFIHRTNWNSWDDQFYVYFTTKNLTHIPPSEFIDGYKGGVHYDSRTISMYKFFAMSLITMICIFILCFIFVNP